MHTAANCITKIADTKIFADTKIYFMEVLSLLFENFSLQIFCSLDPTRLSPFCEIQRILTEMV